MSEPTVKCPYCPFSRGTADVDQPRHAVAQHMAQKNDHDVKTYSQGLRVLEKADADGEGPGEVPEGGRSPPRPDGMRERAHLTMPGEVETSLNERRPCPECGDLMTPTGVGVIHVGEHQESGDRVAVETESGDEKCDECSILVTEDGMRFTDVR